MNKKMFVLIVVLMSISLIGIVSVQYFWVQNAIETNDKQFTNDVEYALNRVSENISKREQTYQYERLTKRLDSLNDLGQSFESGTVESMYYETSNPQDNSTFRYTSSLIEENHKFPSDFEQDTIMLKRFFTRDEYTQMSSVNPDMDVEGSVQIRSKTKFKRWADAEMAWVDNFMRNQTDSIPFNRRTSASEIRNQLEVEFEKIGVDIDFKFAVYNNDLPTSVKSGYFRLDKGESFQVPMFYNGEGESMYQLYVTFPKKRRYILTSIGNILMLSIFFILIIIIVFTSSLYQMIKQKKISEIKTDFINNMTHEFKTPIATINLATDAIRNPKIIEDQSKILRYVQMINDENIRMHEQVENVLRISKLEKNELSIEKETIDFQEVVEDAMSHIELLVSDRQGTINTHFEAVETEVYGSEFHLTNMCVNVLENAMKYSEGAPIIDVYTKNEGGFFVLSIADKGIGMSKVVQKNIFEKFYREASGNIHNVKGHGLGLSYVKQIVKRHGGTISVSSEKGKGSIFTIKIKLIN